MSEVSTTEAPAEIDADRVPVEEEWSQVAGQVQADMTQLLTQLGSEWQYDLPNLLEDEHTFFTETLKAIDRAKATHAEIELYFDVDFTLSIYTSEDELDENGKVVGSHNINVLRPSAPFVLEAIRRRASPTPVRFGLLTTRNRPETLELLQKTTQYGTLASAIDPDLVVASDRVGRSLDADNIFAAMLDSGLVGKDLLAGEFASDRQAAAFASHDVDKLATIQKLRLTKPATVALVVADDLPYPSLLNEAYGVFGIPLWQHGDLKRLMLHSPLWPIKPAPLPPEPTTA